MKFLTTSIFCVAMFFTSYSQDLHFGLGGGVNSSSLISREAPIRYYSNDLGFQIAAIVEYKFCDKMSLRLEPGFENRGVLGKFETDYTNLRFNNVSLPAMATFSVSDKLTFMAGPELAYILSSDLHTGNFRENTFEFGFKAGFSFNITDHFELAFKYFRGLRPTDQWDITDINGNPDGRYRFYYQGLSLSVFYRI